LPALSILETQTAVKSSPLIVALAGLGLLQFQLEAQDVTVRKAAYHPVPESATAMLFGFGVLAIAIRAAT